MIRTKRAYEPASPGDGRRILIDRLWPRGVTKAEAEIDEWRRDLAPSDELRVWFRHDPMRFPRFRERYREELLEHRDALASLASESRRRPLTLVYAAKDSERSNAVVLKELLEEVLSRDSSAREGKLRRGYS